MLGIADDNIGWVTVIDYDSSFTSESRSALLVVVGGKLSEDYEPPYVTILIFLVVGG